MRKFLFLFFTVLLITNCYSVPVVLDIGDFQIEMDAAVSINTNENINVKRNGESISLSQSQYLQLKQLLDNVYTIPSTPGLRINVYVDSFSIEIMEFLTEGFPIRQQVLDYWYQIYHHHNFNTPLPNISRVSKEFWDNNWWHGNKSQYTNTEVKSYLDHNGNSFTKNVLVVPDLFFE